MYVHVKLKVNDLLVPTKSDVTSFRIRADSTLSIREEATKGLPQLKGGIALDFLVQGQGKVYILAVSVETTRQLWLKEICGLVRDVMIPLLQPTSKSH